MDISNFKISTRLNAGFGFILLGALLISATGSYSIYRSSLVTDHLVNELFSKERLITEWYNNTNLNGTRVLDTQHMSDEAAKLAVESKISKTSARISEIQKMLEAMPRSAAEKTNYEAIASRRVDYLAARKVYFADNKSGDADRAHKSETAMVASLAVYLKAIQDLVDIQAADIVRNETDVKNQFVSSQTILGTLTGLVILLSFVCAYLIKNSILHPLRQAINVTKNVTLGNMNTKFDVRGDNELSELLWGLKGLTENLTALVGQVRSGAEIVAATSNEMASGSRDLSDRTEQQAGSLEETASSMEQLTVTVQQNAENARQANLLAASASSVAIKGGTAVSQVVATMKSINESSRKIADITGVIDSIAFQTNILALNAAVEAARAGEQGRGFAVVASEVRHLAQRSAAAANEIKALIEDSVHKVEAGGREVDYAGTTMEEIVESIQKVSDIVSEIMQASQEQNSGIQQISSAIKQLDDMTQQNAILVEDSFESIKNLESQAADLLGVVKEIA